MTHVVDGGSLLQRIPWKKGDTFKDIASMYMKHVSKNFSIRWLYSTVINQDLLPRT